MKLIVGLGNPGKEYEHTRHNTGFKVLDYLALQQEETWQQKTKFLGHVIQTTFSSQPVLLLKPQTFYNDSGQSVRLVKDFFKIDNKDILVVHDELALPFGTLRSRMGGSDAGNNGIKSINAHIGQDYARIRIGIWHEARDKIDDTDFVLGRFSATENAAFPKLLEQAEVIINSFAADIFESTSYKV